MLIILIVAVVLAVGFWYIFWFASPLNCPEKYYKIGSLNKSIESKEDVLREITIYVQGVNESKNPDIIFRYKPFTIDEIDSKEINGEHMWVFSKKRLALNGNGILYGRLMCF